MKKCLLNNRILRYIIYILLITIIYGYNISKRYFPAFIPDEIGYWATAASMNGNDWSSVMSKSPYYGFGYGIILSILFNIKDIFFRYIIAEMLNIIFIIFTFILLVKIIKFCCDIENVLAELICFSSILYPSNVAYAHVTLSEIFLVFLYISLSYYLLKYLEKPKITNGFALAFLVFFLFGTHLRTIVVIFSLLAVLVLFVIISRKQMNIKKIYPFFLIIAVIIAVWIIKEMVIENLYTDHVDGFHDDINDAVLEKLWFLKELGNIEFWKSLIKSIEGKLFYFGCSTFFGIFIGTKGSIEYVQDSLKKRDIIQSLLLIFFLMSFWGSVILTIFLTVIPARVDHVFYGRYAEYCIMPLICMGYVYLFKNRKGYRAFAMLIFIFSIFSIDIYKWLSQTQYKTGLYMQMTGISGWISKKMAQNEDTASLYVLTVFLITIIMLVVVHIIRRKNYILFLLAMSCSWVVVSQNVLKKELFNGEFTINQTMSIHKQVMENYSGEEIYYVCIKDKEEREQNNSYFLMLALQYTFSDISLNIIYETDINDTPDESIVIVHKDIPDFEKMIFGNIIAENEYYLAYIKAKNE